MNLYNKESEVIELLLTDFNKIKNKKYILNKKFEKKPGLIVLYIPMCKHCINLVETWSYLAILFKDRFIFGGVNTKNYKDNLNINDYLNIPMRYPTLLFVNNKGLISKYKGQITKNDLIIFICNNLEDDI
jgi:hypothetical protein